jgi:hypothetical protein
MLFRDPFVIFRDNFKTSQKKFFSTRASEWKDMRRYEKQWYQMTPKTLHFYIWLPYTVEKKWEILVISQAMFISLNDLQFRAGSILLLLLEGRNTCRYSHCPVCLWTSMAPLGKFFNYDKPSLSPAGRRRLHKTHTYWACIVGPAAAKSRVLSATSLGISQSHTPASVACINLIFFTCRFDSVTI